MKLIQEITKNEAAGIRFVLMDIDDTLTKEGKLLAASYTALWKLKEAGLKVIPITGRPAGWCDLIAREWPVDGVVGENGALVFWEETQTCGLPVLKAEYHTNAVRNNHPILEGIKKRVLREVPGIRVAKDQFARLFDMALDFAEEDPVLPLEAALKVKAIAIEEGAMAKVSSIHVNIWMGKYDKLSMSEQFLMKRFDWKAGIGDQEVVFVGDSPNDEPMFARFPLSCAVANIRYYEALIQHFPTFVASEACGEGFAEIARTILIRRRPNEQRDRVIRGEESN
jgi:HAD superfamily hydrolase (TIGR01484 family)